VFGLCRTDGSGESLVFCRFAEVDVTGSDDALFRLRLVPACCVGCIGSCAGNVTVEGKLGETEDRLSGSQVSKEGGADIGTEVGGCEGDRLDVAIEVEGSVNHSREGPSRLTVDVKDTV